MCKPVAEHVCQNSHKHMQDSKVDALKHIREMKVCFSYLPSLHSVSLDERSYFAF